MVIKMIKYFLGLQKTDQRVSEMKHEVHQYARIVMRKYTKINGIMTREGITMDIAKASSMIQ